MENEDEAREEVEFDLEKQQEWEGMKAKRKMETYRVLKKGIEMGVPRLEIDSVLQEDVEKMNAQGNYGFEFWIRTRLGLGLPEEVRAIGEEAYRRYLDQGNFAPAADLAKELYGPDSSEHQDLVQKLEIEDTEEYDAPLAQLAEDATLLDLIIAWGKLKAYGRPHRDLDVELHYNYGPDLVKDFQKITSTNEAGNISIIDFFGKHNISKDNIEIVLKIELG